MKKKIYWREFEGTQAFEDMQAELAEHGYQMVVIYGRDPVTGQKVAIDVHPYKEV